MTAKEFYLNTPLYSPIPIVNEDSFRKLLRPYSCDNFHGFNPIDKIETTFNLAKGHEGDYNLGDTILIYAKISCKRTYREFYFSLLYNGQNKTLLKFGQFPSVADFHTSKAKEYDKIFNKDYLKEYVKSIGLAAHGVGIGSFVYLRRIFERLIEEAKEAMSIHEKIVDYPNHMVDKISFLSDYLPKFLVDHKELYGILSKGIHELTEDECLSHFDVVKVGIEFILDEKLEKFEKDRKIKEASERIKQTHAAIKNNTSP